MFGSFVLLAVTLVVVTAVFAPFVLHTRRIMAEHVSRRAKGGAA